ncbi:MAG: tetratricopeptide repeat protein [Bacteroidota bacterium]
MKIWIKYCWIICLALFPLSVFADNRTITDSLISELDRADSDSLKADILNKLGVEYIGIDLSLAGKYTDQAMEFCRKTGNNRGLAESYNSIGNIYYYRGDYELAIENWLNALRIAERNNYMEIIAKCSGNIGLIYEQQKDYNNALEYHIKSLRLNKAMGNHKGIIASLRNISICHHFLGDADKELMYDMEALDMAKELGDSVEMAVTFNNIGTVYFNLKDYSKALEYHTLAYDLFMRANNMKGIAEALANIGLNEVFKSEYDSASVHLYKSLSIANQSDYMLLVKTIYQYLSVLYEKKHDFKQAGIYFRKYLVIKDSLLNAENQRKISELEAIYDTEKRDMAIRNKQLKLQEEQVETGKQNQQLIFLSVVIIILVITILYFIRNFYQRRNLNRVLKLYNVQITQQKEEIQAQRDLAAGQRDLIIDQKREITDSIEFAQTIQKSLLQSENYIRSIVPDYFILYKPRDIVSGDFYWFGSVGEKIIIIGADCTGHGVPGALMSVLGISFLNKIVNTGRTVMPEIILEKLRENIVDALKQSGENKTSADGMDMVAITLEAEKKSLSFAGANNSFMVIHNKELVEIKGDRMPVGIYEKMNPFTRHDILLNSGDIIYLFSDGYIDQFGGKAGRKYLMKNFRKLLESVSMYPMSKQKEEIDKEYEIWKGEYEQIDDVMVIGFRI